MPIEHDISTSRRAHVEPMSIWVAKPIFVEDHDQNAPACLQHPGPAHGRIGSMNDSDCAEADVSCQAAHASTDGSPSKSCPKCGCTVFYARGTKCKQCSDKQAAEWRKAHPEKTKSSKRRHYEEHAQERRDGSREYRRNNPDAVSALNKKWREANRDRCRNYFLLRAYGVTLDQVKQMIDQQEGKCAACRLVDVSASDRKSHVDHDHTTGKVRGVLCHNCNMAIGHLKDSPLRIRRLLAYIERNAPELPFVRRHGS